MIQRRKAGMSQEQLADRLGITRQSVSKWEAGSSIPEISKLVAMSELFGVSLDYLLKDYIEEEPGRMPAGNMEQSEENARLEKKMDDLTRYVKGYQYTSRKKIAGIPLVSIRFSRHLGKDSVAKGIIAIGNIAVGVISIGAFSAGVISLGAFAVGIFAIAAAAIGLISCGAFALGVIAFGTAAVGIYSAGVSAIGKEIAVGVAAMGKTAIGETAEGTHCLICEQGMVTRTQVEQFLKETNPRLIKPLKDMLVMFAMHI